MPQEKLATKFPEVFTIRYLYKDVLGIVLLNILGALFCLLCRVIVYVFNYFN